MQGLAGLADECLELFDESQGAALQDEQQSDARVRVHAPPRVDLDPATIAAAVVRTCSRVYPAVCDDGQERPFSPARVRAAFQEYASGDVGAEDPPDYTLHAIACAVLVYAASVDVLACCIERVDDDVPGDSKRMRRTRFVASIVDELDKDPLCALIPHVDSLFEVATHVWTSYRALHLDWFDGYTTLLKATALVPVCGCPTVDGYFDRVASRAQSAPLG